MSADERAISAEYFGGPIDGAIEEIGRALTLDRVRVMGKTYEYWLDVNSGRDGETCKYYLDGDFTITEHYPTGDEL
jgi:hypothetical protein